MFLLAPAVLFVVTAIILLYRNPLPKLIGREEMDLDLLLNPRPDDRLLISLRLLCLLTHFLPFSMVQSACAQNRTQIVFLSFPLLLYLNPLSTGRTLRRQFSCFFPLNFGRWTLTMNIAPTTMS